MDFPGGFFLRMNLVPLQPWDQLSMYSYNQALGSLSLRCIVNKVGWIALSIPNFGAHNWQLQARYLSRILKILAQNLIVEVMIT
jgi:hypothetical protein